MSEVETEAVVVDAEAAGQGPVTDAGAAVAVDPAPVADGVAVGESSPHDASSTKSESSSAVEEPALSTSIDASLTPEFSAPDANPEPPAEFVPASFVPAEFEPSEPSDPSIFTEPEIVSDEDDEDDLDEDTSDAGSEPTADEPEQSDQASASAPPADQAAPSAEPDQPAVSPAPVEPVVPQPVTPADAARAELEALGFVMAADAADAAVLAAAAAEAAPAEPLTVPIPANSAEVTEDVPVVEPTENRDQSGPDPASDETQPVKPAGPKLTPISQLPTRPAAAQRGRASVAPAPFRAEPDPRTQAPALPPTVAPAPAPPPPAPPSHQPHAAGSASVPQAPAQPAAESSRGTAAVPQPTVIAVATVTPPTGLPTVAAPAESRPTAYVEPETDPQSTTYTEPPTEPRVKLKPALKPMGPAGVSARARVAPLDPNRIPLGPTAEERAAAAQAEAARVAAERAEAQRVANERAEAQRVANERAEAQRAANERAAAQRAANERAMQERAGQARAAQQRAAAEHAAQVAAFQAAQAEAARVDAARAEAARVDAAQRGAHEQAMRERAAHEQFARDQAARDQATRDQTARDQAARDQAARDQAARSAAAAQAAAASTVRSTAPQAFPQYAPGLERDATPWSPAVADANVPVPEGKKRRAGRLALVAGIVVVALLGGGFVGLKVLRNTPKPDLAKVPVFATPAAVLEVPASAAPMPTIAGMAAAVGKLLHAPGLGAHVSFQVSDLATGKVLFSQNRFGPTTPASTMKLATASAMLGLRGPNYRLTTKVVAGPHPGEVVLIGGGDPTLSASSDNPNYPEAARISDLAKQVKQALGSTKPTKVIIDTSLFSGPTTGPGWDKNDAHSSYATAIYALTTDAGRKDPNEEGDADRFDNTALAAGQIFAKLLGLPTAAVTSGRATAGATELGSVQSAPLLRIIENMLITSDNVVAEFMARQVAIALNQPASFAGGAAAVIGQLTKMGIPMQGVTIVDGSGLSPKDRLTPAMLGSLLHYAASDANPNMHGLFSGLPVAGWSGTLARRFTTKGTTGARGVFRAKTGTLTGVHALAGTVVDASGRPLVFVLLLDKVPWNVNYGAAMDKLGAAVAACGCTS